MIKFEKKNEREEDFELAKEVFEQYKKVNQTILSNCVNLFFDKYDVMEQFGYVTDVIIIDIMEKLGHEKDEDHLFEIILEAIDENKSWDYLMLKFCEYEKYLQECDDNIYCECGCGRVIASKKELVKLSKDIDEMWRNF